MGEDFINGGNRRVVQKVAVKQGGWTKATRRRFLAALAESCNVRMATEACGMKGKSPYDLRKRDPEFAALWAEALAIGYERLEEALLRHALSSLNAIAVGEYSDEVAAELEDGTTPATGDAVARPPMVGSGLRADRLAPSEVQAALAILNRHRATVEGRRGAVRGKPRMTPEQTDAQLKKQLDMLARRLAARDAAEADAAGADAAGADA